MRLFDIHSHILPCIDDGAKDLNESIKLLEMLGKQDVTDVLATPHFYPHIQSAEDFLDSREKAVKKLMSKIKGKNLPKIHIGCELFYFDEMGKIGDIKPFTLADSNYILLELSMTKVTERVIKTVENLCEMGYIPIIAHIERYLGFRGIRGILKLIEQKNCLAQVNASSIVFGKSNKKILNLIKKGYIYVIGSDAHSVDERPPVMDKAFEIIENRCGEAAKKSLVANSDRLYSEIIGDGYEE